MSFTVRVNNYVVIKNLEESRFERVGGLRKCAVLYSVRSIQDFGLATLMSSSVLRNTPPQKNSLRVFYVHINFKVSIKGYVKLYHFKSLKKNVKKTIHFISLEINYSTFGKFLLCEKNCS